MGLVLNVFFLRICAELYDAQNYSVMLVIPDFYDRAYVREMANLLLNTMGFKQLCAQQESLGATFGAGISNACVVDIGATQTNIACVDEGLVLPDTRSVGRTRGSGLQLIFTLGWC